MRKCTRFDDEGLLKLERGEKLDEHYSTCQDCIETKKKYIHLCELIKHSFDDVKPSKGWEQKVFDHIDSHKKSRFPSKNIWLPTAVAATLVVLVWSLNIIPFADNTSYEAEFTSSLSSNGNVWRSVDSAHVGDKLNLNATTTAKHVVLRIYLNSQTLSFECGIDQACQQSANNISASYILPGYGIYQPVLIYSNNAITTKSTGNLDQDILIMHDQGAKIIMGDNISVK